MNSAFLLCCALLGQPRAPSVIVTSDDTVIDRSCLVVIAAGRIIPDANGDGVLQIRADNITVEFARGSVLMGAEQGTPGDALTGIGIRINGHKGVVLKDARVSGYKVGVHATAAPGLSVEKADLSGNFRQRLRSTPSGEDGADWLYPHHNEQNEWATKYGAALYVEDSDGVTIRDVRVREGQNGIILDRVNSSRIFDNDCSFLSGWGLALWRSSGNTITRNAFDFCVRGHVEGVYNRGQDSAGILCFEQNSNNVIAENSATHGGDGFFGFAGVEALNGEGAPRGFDHTRKGNNDNLLIDNDFSYAPAHGIEMTFSFGNKFIRNRLVENAICGVWGGYSQETLIAGNTFEGNGGMGYGLERGGVNIEHGVANVIVGNTFINNKCGVHLWWRDNGDFATKAWGKANYRGVLNNTVAGNTFAVNHGHPFKNLRPEDKLITLHLRGNGEHVVGTSFVNNTMKLDGAQAVETVADEGILIARTGETPAYAIPAYEVLGVRKPVGARPQLRGRDKIIMTEWGPWDHESPLIRLVRTAPGTHTYEVYNLDPTAVSVSGIGLNSGWSPATEPPKGAPRTLSVSAALPGIAPYRIDIKDRRLTRTLTGTIVNASWDAVFFKWAGPEGEREPPADLESWRALAQSAGAVKARLGALNLLYGYGGPSQVVDDAAVKAAGFGGDYFGMIATTSLPLKAGTWRIRTRSDDGIRVIVDGATVLEDWTHHGPTPRDAELKIDADRTVTITVEHFEIFGYSTLEFSIEPVE